MNGKNATSQLYELLQNLGCDNSSADFKTKSESLSGSHCSSLVVTFPDGRKVYGTGVGKTIAEANIAASKDALDQLQRNHSDLLVNWDLINIEAQAGDALIKLSAYCSVSLSSAGEKSKFLQDYESDAHLEKVFDLWKSKGDPDISIWGDKLGRKKKATLVESLLWKRFGRQIISIDADKPLESLLETLGIEKI